MVGFCTDPTVTIDLALTPNDELYIIRYYGSSDKDIRKVGPALPGVGLSDISLASVGWIRRQPSSTFIEFNNGV
jgi:hypothetical protein